MKRRTIRRKRSVKRGGKRNLNNRYLQTNDIMFQKMYDDALKEYITNLPRNLNSRALQKMESDFGIYFTNYAYILAKWASENNPDTCMPYDDYVDLDLSYYEINLVRCIDRNIRTPIETDNNIITHIEIQNKIKDYIFGIHDSMLNALYKVKNQTDLCRLPGPFKLEDFKPDYRFIDRDGKPYPPPSPLNSRTI
jgi:hypothetical protein